MTTHHSRDRAESAVLAALPGRAHDLARLRVLAAAGLPVVTVIGKYNHGKSRLLNELIGHAAFGVADRRETIALAEHAHDGVCWLDAPGLDADVHTADDDHALQAIWLRSDIRLFVHAAKEGELDAAERERLAGDQRRVGDGDERRRRRQAENFPRLFGDCAANDQRNPPASPELVGQRRRLEGERREHAAGRFVKNLAIEDVDDDHLAGLQRRDVGLDRQGARILRGVEKDRRDGTADDHAEYL